MPRWIALTTRGDAKPKAIQQARIAEQLDAQYLDPHYVLGVAFRAAGRFDDADFHCKRLAQNDRQSSLCWAEMFLRQGRADEALRILETAWNDNLLQMGAETLGVAVELHFTAGTAFALFQRFPAIKYNDLLYLTTGMLHVTTGLLGVRFSRNCPALVIALYRWNHSQKHRPKYTG